MSIRRTYSLLDLDDGLGEFVAEDRRPAARAELQVEVHRLPIGPLNTARLAAADPEHVGLLIVEGVVSREVVVSDIVSTELLGPGDLLRPWVIQHEAPMLRFEIRWNGLTEGRIAVLDRRFGARLVNWPEVNSVLMDRLTARSQRLAVTQAISQLNRVDRRILALFWHLADRWGRVTPDGLLVPLTLSHRMVGQLVGARRPTVSTAVAKLAASGELVRRDNGTWVVKGAPVGLPVGEARRMVPIRRRLIGREPDAAATLAAPALGVTETTERPGYRRRSDHAAESPREKGIGM